MADEEIYVLFSLEDQFTKPIKSVTNRIKDFQVKVKETKNTVNSFGKGANGIFIKVAKDASNMGTALSNSISKSGMNKAMEFVLSNQTSALQGFWSTATVTSQTSLDHILRMSEDVTTAISSQLEGLKETIQTVADTTSELQISGNVDKISDSINSVSAGAANTVTDVISGLNEKANTSVTGADVSESIGMFEKLSIAANTVVDTIGSAKNIVEDMSSIKDIIKPAENDSDEGSLTKLAEVLGKSQDLSTTVGSLLGNLEQLGKNITNVTAGAVNTGSQTVSGAKSKTDTLDTMVEASDSKGSVDTLSTVVDTIGNIKNVVEDVKGIYDIFKPEEIESNNEALEANRVQLLAQKAGLLASKGAQLISQGATIALTAAQWALNAAMTFFASPVGLVVLGIMALIAVGVLLYKNWDTVKEKASELWGKVQEVFGGIKDFIVGVFQSVMDTVGPIIDGLVEKIQPILDKVHEFIEAIKENPVVEGFISGWDTVKDKVTGIISSKATGTPYFKGGLTHINEGGRGEIVNLPNGTQIIPHDIAKRQSSQPIVNVSVNVQGNLIGNNDYANYIGGVVARRVVAAYGNM